jgi:hypothetical protein
MTTYKSQGQTYDKVVVEADTSAPQLQDQRNTYVQITRARDDVRVFTDDRAALREVSAILNYKTDTFSVDVSLEKAATMERRVHAEAFGDRARREAEAKIRFAEVSAAAGAERLERMVENSTLPLVVSNEDFLSGAGKSKTLLQGYQRHLAAVTESLRRAEMLSDAEKGIVARELSKPESTRALLQTIDHANRAVAFAVVRSGAADLPQAAAGLSAADAKKIAELLAAAKKVEELTAELKVCRSAAGYYLGKMEDGEPAGRYSEFWDDEIAAAIALRTGRFSFRDGIDRGREFGL